MAEGAVHLVAEAHAALSSDLAIANVRTPSTLHRFFSAAAVRHCSLPLLKIEQSAAAGQEMTARIQGRIFIEA